MWQRGQNPAPRVEGTRTHPRSAGPCDVPLNSPENPARTARPASPAAGFATRPLTEADVPALAALHRVTFDHAAVSQLGQAVTERYYRSILADAKEGLLLGTFRGGRLAAFVISGVWDEPEKEFLRRNLPFVATRLLLQPGLLFQPFIQERIRGGLAMLWPARRKTPQIVAPSAAQPPPAPVRSLGILYIGVHPDFRGLGLARRLLKQVEAHAYAGGFAQLDLSVYLDNSAAIELYLSDGWQKRLSGAVWKGFMIKPLRG
jgi:ribosomal protein S18 acetylase RimI-like enzyme